MSDAVSILPAQARRLSLQREAALVPALPSDAARVGKCYSNVRRAIEQFGGDFVYGWALTDFGPHCLRPSSLEPLYRRWLNHVVWRDAAGKLWEVSPHAAIDDPNQRSFLDTCFLTDPEAIFDVVSHDEWYGQPCRYVPIRPEGAEVADLLNQAQHAIGDEARLPIIQRALAALASVGFVPREWRVECIGQRTGSIWLIAD